MQPDDPLPTSRLEAGAALAPAQPLPAAAINLHSPALEVLTDLTQVKAAMVRPETPVREAEQQMIVQGVRLLFVVHALPQVQGLITAADIRGEHQLRLLHERGIAFDDLRVDDLMTPLPSLDTVEFSQLRRARVGNVVATLQRIGRHHLLVVETSADATPARVRGLFSRSQIERQLGTAIDLAQIVRCFTGIGRAAAA